MVEVYDCTFSVSCANIQDVLASGTPELKKTLYGDLPDEIIGQE